MKDTTLSCEGTRKAQIFTNETCFSNHTTHMTLFGQRKHVYTFTSFLYLSAVGFVQNCLPLQIGFWILFCRSNANSRERKRGTFRDSYVQLLCHLNVVKFHTWFTCSFAFTCSFHGSVLPVKLLLHCVAWPHVSAYSVETNLLSRARTETKSHELYSFFRPRRSW